MNHEKHLALLVGRAIERLADAGLLSSADLDRARAAVRDGAESPERALVDLGICTEDQVTAALAQAASLTVVVPYASMIDSSLVARFPLDLLERFRALPVATGDDGSVYVAFATPPSTAIIEELQRAVRRRVEPALAAPSKLDRALARVLSGSGEGAAREAEERVDPGALGLLFGSLAAAVAHGGTEVRFDPTPQGIEVRQRVGRYLETIGRADASQLRALCQRARIFAGDRAGGSGPVAGRTIRTEIGGRSLRLDVTIGPDTPPGPWVRIRFAPEPSGEPVHLAVPAEVRARLACAVRPLRGLLLCCSADPERGAALARTAVIEAGPGRAFAVAVGAPLASGLAGVRACVDVALALESEPDLLVLDERCFVAGASEGLAERLVGRAEESLVVATSSEPGPTEALLAWLERGARPSRLARVFIGVLVDGDPIRLEQPDERVRERACGPRSRLWRLADALAGGRARAERGA